jgi:hypothetical protein
MASTMRTVNIGYVIKGGHLSHKPACSMCEGVLTSLGTTIENFGIHLVAP